MPKRVSPPVTKRPRFPVHGILLLDKPKGVSSNDALQQVKRLFQALKTGHTGTLDPLASGLLPLMFGEATKFAADLIDASKTYVATARLGFESNTGDAEGQLTLMSAFDQVQALTVERINEVLLTFLGLQQQVPPMYSALKRDGKPLYEYARQGIEVAIEPRQIEIEHLVLLSVDRDPQLQQVNIQFEVKCSKGTYIRTLAQDIGRQLGTGAYLIDLRRTAVGDLRLDDAYTPNALQQVAEQGREPLLSLLQPVDSLLQSLPCIVLNSELAERFNHGQRLSMGTQSAQGRVRVYATANWPLAQRSTENGHTVSTYLLGMGFLHNDGSGNSLLAPDRLIKLET